MEYDIKGPGERAVHDMYASQRKRKACCTIGRRAAGHFVLKEIKMLLEETADLRQQLAEERESPAIAAMWGHHSRDDEVRELRVLCSDLAEALAMEVDLRGDASGFDLDKAIQVLKRYRKRFPSLKVGT